MGDKTEVPGEPYGVPLTELLETGENAKKKLLMLAKVKYQREKEDIKKSLVNKFLKLSKTKGNTSDY